MVPQIDFRPFREAAGDERRRAARTIGEAARTSGFFYLAHSGVAPDTVDGMLARSRAFFALPETQKLERRWDGRPPVVGYLPREREALDESRPPDLKEAFNVPPPVPAGAPAPEHRAWPDPADPLRAEAEAFAALCFALGQEVLAAIALALELPETFFTAGHRAADQTLRLLHYFPVAPHAAPRQLGAGDHSDHGTLTLLFQDATGGLEMHGRDGAWHPLPPVPGTVLVNAGDLLARWTGGAVRSAPHRVLATSRHRYSLAYFLIPRFEVVLRCPPTAVLAGTPATPPPLTAEEFLLLRSLRRSERFYRHQGPRPDAGALPKGLADMRSLVAERLGLDQDGLDRRLADFGPGDPRDALGAGA